MASGSGSGVARGRRNYSGRAAETGSEGYPRARLRRQRRSGKPGCGGRGARQVGGRCSLPYVQLPARRARGSCRRTPGRGAVEPDESSRLRHIQTRRNLYERATRGVRMSTPGRPAQDLNWLITNFVERVPDVAHAVVVSSDGLPLAFSAGFPQERADQLAAVTSGLTSLTQGASRVFEGGAVVQTVVEMQRGVLVIMAISNGSSLAVLAASTCDLGLVAYEMTLLVERAGRVLTPATRGIMQAAIPGDGRR